VNGNAMSRHISYRHHVIKVCFQLDRYACALRRAGCFATPWTIEALQSTSGFQPAAPPAALYGHTVVRPHMVVVAATQTCCRGPPSYVVHLLSCLTRYYTYIFIYYVYSLLCLRTCYVTAYSITVKSAVMTAVAAHSFVRSFVRS